MTDHIELDAAATASPEQVAALLGTSGWCVREQVRLGRFEHLRVGGRRVRFTARRVERLVELATVTSESPSPRIAIEDDVTAVLGASRRSRSAAVRSPDGWRRVGQSHLSPEGTTTTNREQRRATRTDEAAGHGRGAVALVSDSAVWWGSNPTRGTRQTPSDLQVHRCAGLLGGLCARVLTERSEGAADRSAPARPTWPVWARRGSSVRDARFTAMSAPAAGSRRRSRARQH